MKISVVIPAYNEKGNLEELTERFLTVFKENKINDYEFVYVIQGQDGTYESMKELKEKKGIKNIKPIYYEKAIGVGPAFVVGFKNISDDSTLVVTMDGDLNHQPEELPSFIKKMEETDSDIIIGSRMVKGGKLDKYPSWKGIVSGFTNKVLPFLTGCRVKDLTSGYRLIKSDVIKKLRGNITSRNFEFYPEFLIKAKNEGFSMIETPIHFKYRIRGKSKLNFFTSGSGYIKLLLRLFFRRYK